MSTDVSKSKIKHAPVLSHLSVADAVVNLVNGYVRNNNDTYFFTLQLRIIIMEYIMDIFIRFDTSAGKAINDIFRNGTFIHRGLRSIRKEVLPRGAGRKKAIQRTLSGSCSSVIFASSTGYNQGVHEWKIKVSGECQHASKCGIGVMSDINGGFDCNPKGLEHSMYNLKCDCYFIRSGVIANGYYSKKSKRDYSRSHPIPDWTSGDVITVHLNCNKWTCKFRVNGKMVGSKVAITKSKTYYPAIESSAVDNKFELISTKHIHNASIN